MSSFSEQRRQLQAALVSAGMDPSAAAQIANILGNSAQSMRHAGPLEIDSTPADLRMVTPQARKLRFPNLDFRDGDPDYRQPRVASSEERTEKEPEPNVTPVIAPQQTNANFRVAPGSLTDVAGNGQNARVDVRNVVNARPVQGLPLTMLDSQANQLVGKAPRAQVGQNDGSARLDIQENNREVVWNLQMLNRAEYDVVTKIEYVDGKGLQVTYERIKAWDQQKERVDTIPVVDQPVVTEIVEDKKGIRGERRKVQVFSSRGEANNYFNTFRIGTFTGGWAAGTTKSITQVWPTSTLAVTVKNLTHNVADTPSTKYVLFSPRTKDAVPAAPQPENAADDPLPVTTQPPAFDVTGELVVTDPDGVREPEVEYYAIEIGHAGTDDDSGDCVAFSSLNGLRVDELTGYNAAAPSALSYATSAESATPCLQWRSHYVSVVTNVIQTYAGYVYERKGLYVLAEEPATSLFVPCCATYPPEGCCTGCPCWPNMDGEEQYIEYTGGGGSPCGTTKWVRPALGEGAMFCSSAMPSALSGHATWNPGYPAGFGSCQPLWIRDYALCWCNDENGNPLSSSSTTRYRLIVADCESQTFVDVTGVAVSGQTQFDENGGCGPLNYIPPMVCP